MKILFTDLDGTLLNDEKQIPEVNSTAVKQTLSKGNAVVICTGRSYFSAKKFVDRLGLNQKGCYAILYNGGMIYDCCSGDILYKNTMPMPYVKYIFEQAAYFDLYCQTYEGDYVVTPKDRPEAAQYHWSSQMEVRVDPDLLKHLKEEPVKVLTSCLDDRKKHEAYRDFMLPWARGKVSIFFSSEYYLEHVMEGVSKGAAIRWLCQYLHVPIKQTIGVGDAENDLTMLDAAGFAVCMKNGTREAKNHADHITALDNNQGGVAEIIEKFM